MFFFGEGGGLVLAKLFLNGFAYVMGMARGQERDFAVCVLNNVVNIVYFCVI